MVFLFPGQGAQHAGMARGLYESEPVFAEHFDKCANGFRDELGVDLRAEVFDGPGANLARTDHAQPALFAVEYALAEAGRLLRRARVGVRRAQHRRIRRRHARRCVRPPDRDQGGVGPRAPDACGTARCHGRGCAGPR